jgi:hypothetical protein
MARVRSVEEKLFDTRLTVRHAGAQKAKAARKAGVRGDRVVSRRVKGVVDRHEIFHRMDDEFEYLRGSLLIAPVPDPYQVAGAVATFYGMKDPCICGFMPGPGMCGPAARQEFRGDST